MYQKLPNLVLGFHGCDKSIFDKVVLQGETLKHSENSYDWLGHGIYFWEQNLQRALEWAESSPKISTPAVIGAVIDLGYCLNLTDSASVSFLKRGYEMLKIQCESSGKELPQNHHYNNSNDILLRDLDCAVIQQIHDFNLQTHQPDFDSVRGIFMEGNPPYPGSSFQEKTHVQLCIRNPNCIKGYFSPLEKNQNYPLP